MKPKGPKDQAREDLEAIRGALRQRESRDDSLFSDQARRLWVWKNAQLAREREQEMSEQERARREAIRRYAAGDESALGDL